MKFTTGVRPRLGRAVVGGVLVAVTALAFVAGAGAARPVVRLQLPANVDPVPNFDSSGSGSVPSGSLTPFPNPCVGINSSGQAYFIANDRSVACTDYVLRAIDRARRLEGVGPMVLPSNWYRLSTAQQIFVVTDLERVDRGLAPYAGTNAALNAAAVRGALALADPSAPRGFPMRAAGSNWAGTNSVLEADYSWMYDDGWAGSAATTFNDACTSASASGCWAHREIMLGKFTGISCPSCALGTGFAGVGPAANLGGSYTLIIVRPSTRSLPLTFTWAHDVAPFLAPASSAVSTTTIGGATVTTVKHAKHFGQ